MEEYPKDDSEKEEELKLIVAKAAAVHGCENVPSSVSSLAFTNNPGGTNQIDSSVTTSTEDRTSVGIHSSTFSDANASETWRGEMKPSLMFPNDGQRHETSHWGRASGPQFRPTVQGRQPASQSISQSYGNMNLHSYSESVQQHSTSQWGRIRGIHCSSMVPQYGQQVPQFMLQSSENPILYPHDPVQHRPQQTTPSTSQQNFHNWRLNPMGESIQRDNSHTTQPSLTSVSQPNSSRSNTSDELRQPQIEQESLRTSSSGNQFSKVQESSVSIINSVNQLNTNITGRFTCPICERKFKLKSNLKRHIKILHDQEGPFECNICQKKITGKSRFSSHVEWHSKRGLYVCRTCGNHYLYKTTLTKHEKTHTSDES